MATLLLLIGAAGCGAPRPTASVPPARSTVPSALVGAATPGATASPAPVDDPADAEVSTVLDHGTVHTLSAALFVTTDGTSIVYSGAAEGSADDGYSPDLFRTRPGGEPELIFANPDRDSNLIPVAAADGYVAFGESNGRTVGPKGWVLWLLPPDADEPVELDRNPGNNDAPLPLVAVNERHVVWQAIGMGPELERSELIEVWLPSMTPRVVRSADPQDYQWWDPALDGDMLVYTEVDYVHGDPNSMHQPAALHVMLLDLGVRGGEPLRLDASGRATEPAIHGRTVVWKEADNVFAWGTLTIHDLDSGRSRTVATDPQSGIKTPSVGNRYVGFWGIDDTEFYLYDLKRDEMARVFQISPTSEIGGAFRIEVAGDQAVWVQGSPGGSTIAWARLPSMEDP